MFGYVVPDKPNMMIKDYALYRSVYCGICKSIKESFGNFPRFTTNYDSVFLSILLHNYLKVDYKLEKQRCVLHPLKKRFVARGDELTRKIVSVNILLAYHKFTDDIIDGGGMFKRFARALVVKRAYKKARKIMPGADAIILEQYARLRELEKSNESSIDRVSDCFASMLMLLCRELLPSDNAHMEDIFYNVGKWIYIIDAVDDLEQDKKSGNYNPLIASYGTFTDIEQYKKDIGQKLNFTFNCIFNKLEQEFRQVDFGFNTDVLQNIMFQGLRSRTKTIMECNKCRKIRI